MKIILYESIIFSFVMIIFSFVTSYITDLLLNKKIIWFPKHSFDMITGIFFTSCLVYILFSEQFIRYKLNKN